MWETYLSLRPCEPFSSKVHLLHQRGTLNFIFYKTQLLSLHITTLNIFLKQQMVLAPNKMTFFGSKLDIFCPQFKDFLVTSGLYFKYAHYLNYTVACSISQCYDYLPLLLLKKIAFRNQNESMISYLRDLEYTRWSCPSAKIKAL